MKAIWKRTVIAESDDTIEIEGNHYFPPNSVKHEFLEETPYHTICPWKGEASYWRIEANNAINENGAWTYRSLSEEAKERVGQDFTGYIAFWKGVEFTD